MKSIYSTVAAVVSKWANKRTVANAFSLVKDLFVESLYRCCDTHYTRKVLIEHGVLTTVEFSKTEK